MCANANCAPSWATHIYADRLENSVYCWFPRIFWLLIGFNQFIFALKMNSIENYLPLSLLSFPLNNDPYTYIVNEENERVF